MALTNCPECGNQMSDTAKKCPHCGYRYKVKKLDNKLILGILLIILSIGALIFSEFLLQDSVIYGCYLYDSPNFKAAIVFYLIMLGFGAWSAIIFSKYKKIKNTILSLLLIAILVLIYQFTIKSKVASWNEVSNMRPYANNSITTNEEKYISANENNTTNTINSFIGTYEYIQPRNRQERSKLTITINDDKTAVALSEGRNEKTYYGSWYEYGGQIRLSFTDTDVHTFNGTFADLLVFTDWADQMDIRDGVIYDGYLYENRSFADAKNPEHRVKLEKIN